MYNPYESFDDQTPRFGDTLPQAEEQNEAAPVSAQPETEEIPQQDTAPVMNDTSAWQPSSSYTPPMYAVPYTTAAGKAEKKAKRAKAKKEKKAKSGLGGRIVALALCCSLVGGLIGAGGMRLLSGKSAVSADAAKTSTLVQGQRESTVINVATIDTSKIMTPSEVYAANVNSTVGITTSVTTTNFWGYQTTAAASGSGFIISDDGYILTNFHVIEDATSVTVTMYDDTTYDAELVGYDESNDIAVLKIEAQNLTPVIMGDSDELNVGDSVVAIGNPLGELTFSLTSGTVSALDRKITLSTGVSMELIQTDCAINSGNSGGALLNLYGEVIGITNAKYSSSGGTSASIDNIGFAIPINNVSDIVKSIIEKGYITKPYIGVSVQDVSEDAQNYGLPEGAAVYTVTEDGPAAKAGLQQNDIITAVNGQEVKGSDALVEAIGKTNPGDQVVLSVYRQGQTIELTVTIEEKIQEAKPTQETDTTQSGAAEDYAQPYGQNPYGDSGEGYGQNPYGDSGEGYGQNPYGGSGSEGFGSMNPFNFFGY